MAKTEDRPVCMPCSDPKGCKHFKAEMNLRERIKELTQDLIEYGRHCPGCSQQFAEKYRCRCGWDKVEQALKG